MQASHTLYPIYDLANDHFRNVEIITRNNEVIKGQFVRLAVDEGAVEYLYPSEKYCFLPEEYKNQFLEAHKSCRGIFTAIPSYVKQYSLADIVKIIIEPSLI